MSTTVSCPFDVTGWEQHAYDDATGTTGLSRATVTKSFRGALDARSEAQLLMYQVDAADLSAGAGFVASEVVTGRLDGREGSFVLQHWGLTGDGPPRTGGHVVPGSGTDGLTGLTGTVTFAMAPDGAHSLTLSYSLS